MDARDAKGTYAPQSPDLSGFLSTSTSKSKHNRTRSQQSLLASQGINASTSYAPRSPSFNSFTVEPLPPPQINYKQTLHNTHQHHHEHSLSTYSDSISSPDYDGQYMPPIPDLPSAHSFSSFPAQQINNTLHSHFEPEFLPSHEDSYLTTPPTMSSRGPRIKPDPSFHPGPSAPYKDPNPTNIEIKTKFPVARIKRIMQADEEVGKVAQVTPVVVSKALELFMIALVGGAAEIAKEKGQKRVTAQHIKAVVLAAPEQFDFLAEIVGRVSEAQEGAGGEGKKRKEKVEKDSDSSEEEKKPKKGRGGRRKKNSDD